MSYRLEVQIRSMITTLHTLSLASSLLSVKTPYRRKPPLRVRLRRPPRARPPLPAPVLRRPPRPPELRQSTRPPVLAARCPTIARHPPPSRGKSTAQGSGCDTQRRASAAPRGALLPLWASWSVTHHQGMSTRWSISPPLPPQLIGHAAILNLLGHVPRCICAVPVPAWRCRSSPTMTPPTTPRRAAPPLSSTRLSTHPAASVLHCCCLRDPIWFVQIRLSV